MGGSRKLENHIVKMKRSYDTTTALHDDWLEKGKTRHDLTSLSGSIYISDGL